MHDWDRTYADVDELQLEAPWSTLELAGVLAGLDPKPTAALDVGCGTGGDAVYLAEQGIVAFGVDPNEAALELAQRRAERAGVEVGWREGDATALPLEDASVDLVTDRGCLHHVPTEEQPAYAREVARVLRPGGVFVVRDMAHGGGHSRGAAHAHDHGGGEAHAHAHAHGSRDPGEMVSAMVAGTPLRVTSVVPFRQGPVSGTIVVARRD